jgi:uncharacterized membrane protein YhaH (DUF805 family)
VGAAFRSGKLECEGYIGTTKVEDRTTMDLMHVFFSFRGRINRKTFWLATLLLAVGYVVAEVMTVSADETVIGLGYLIMIGLLWPSLAVQTKRWHDRNRTGWWNLIGFIPIAGPIWALVEVGFLKGTGGVNFYGLPPDARLSDDYGGRIISHVQDAQVTDPLVESGTAGDGGAVKNAWRGA